MKITVVGGLAILAVIVAAVLLVRHLNQMNIQPPDENPS